MAVKTAVDLAAQILLRMAAAEAREIERSELEEFGHRLIFDRTTGACKNVCGILVDPSTLDENGYQVRH
jgi:hypothetical protein